MVVEPLGEAWAVFSRASGETHLLNHAAATLLELLTEQPDTVPGLAERLAAEMQVDTAAVAQLVEEAVRGFVDTGLVDTDAASQPPPHRPTGTPA